MAIQVIAGRYRVVRPLGTPGAQGEVYEVFDLHEEDTAALKLLTSLPPLGVWVEARILRRLSDRHILPIRNADVTPQGVPYIVTDLAQQGSLDHLLAQTASCGLQVDDVVRWIRQACHGIARAHDLRLLHNDIKPGNLFLNAKDECLVADFGFASEVPIGSSMTMANGCTPETVAPEIAAAPQSTTASLLSDVYSLGATAYWLLAAHPSHDFTNLTDPFAQLALVATQVPPRLRNVAPHVRAYVANAIERAMSRNPHDRYENVTSFAEALGRRPGVERRWRRTDEHPGHHGCWRGTPAYGSEYVLCLEPTPKPKEHLVVTRHAASGNRVPGGQRTAAARSWGQAVRAVMDQLK